MTFKKSNFMKFTSHIIVGEYLHILNEHEDTVSLSTCNLSKDSILYQHIHSRIDGYDIHSCHFGKHCNRRYRPRIHFPDYGSNRRMHFPHFSNVLIIFINKTQNAVEGILCFPSSSNGGSEEETYPSFHIIMDSGVLQ